VCGDGIVGIVYGLCMDFYCNLTGNINTAYRAKDVIHSSREMDIQKAPQLVPCEMQSVRRGCMSRKIDIVPSRDPYWGSGIL